jgi:hypothetical protein
VIVAAILARHPFTIWSHRGRPRMDRTPVEIEALDGDTKCAAPAARSSLIALIGRGLIAAPVLE